MKCFSNLSVIGLAAIAALGLAGCPLLAIGGFGYTGYQYKEKEGVFAPGQPLGGPAPADNSSRKAAPSQSQSPPSLNDIE